MEGGRNQLLNLHQRILAMLMLVSTWCRAAFCILILCNSFFLYVNVVCVYPASSVQLSLLIPLLV